MKNKHYPYQLSWKKVFGSIRSPHFSTLGCANQLPLTFFILLLIPFALFHDFSFALFSEFLHLHFFVSQFSYHYLCLNSWIHRLFSPMPLMVGIQIVPFIVLFIFADFRFPKLLFLLILVLLHLLFIHPIFVSFSIASSHFSSWSLNFLMTEVLLNTSYSLAWLYIFLCFQSVPFPQMIQVWSWYFQALDQCEWYCNVHGDRRGLKEHRWWFS